MLNVIIAIFSVVLGAVGSLLIVKYTITANKIREMSDTIKNIFIDDLQRINDLDSNQDSDASRIVVDNIYNTDTLINKFFFYIGDRKTKKISTHYDEYKKPYEIDPLIASPIRVFDKENIVYPKSYGINKVENAREKAIISLKKLIDDF